MPTKQSSEQTQDRPHTEQTLFHLFNIFKTLLTASLTSTHTLYYTQERQRDRELQREVASSLYMRI